METVGGAGCVVVFEFVLLEFVLLALLTLTVTAALDAVWPAESLAIAISVWLPLERELALIEVAKGALAIAEPTSLPSSLY